MKFNVLLVFLLLSPAFVFAADDTFSCLNQLGGPTEVISGDKGYWNFSQGSWPADKKFDARTGTWKNEVYPTDRISNNWQITLGGNWKDPVKERMCWAGGTVIGTNDRNASWVVFKNAAGEGIQFNAKQGIVDGMRIDNLGEDGIGVIHGTNFVLKDLWVSHIFDDCIENDHLGAGFITDSLFDGCYYFLSIDPGANYGGDNREYNTVTIDGVLARAMKVNMDGRDYDPAVAWFKTHSASPSLVIKNSVFAFENSFDSGPVTRLQRAFEKTKSCSNNVIAWLSDTPFPSNFPTPPSCFRIVKGQEARTLWANAKQNWINCHPKVGRVPGDPSSNESLCNASAYGGGGSAAPGGGTTGPVVGACNQFEPGTAPPAGYGASWNVVRTDQLGGLFLSAYCNANGSVKYTVGVPDYRNDDLYVYNVGYYYANGKWNPLTFAGSFIPGSTAWLRSVGEYTHSGAPQTNYFWVGYTCKWIAAESKWKCGCRDAACTQPYWQLQGVKR